MVVASTWVGIQLWQDLRCQDSKAITLQLYAAFYWQPSGSLQGQQRGAGSASVWQLAGGLLSGNRPMQAGMLVPALAAAATLAALCTQFIQYAAAMASGDVRVHMRAAGNLQESHLQEQEGGSSA